MSPQLENGYTMIAHEILTNTAKLKLNGTQLRILLIVWRYTYGFSRKETDLSVSFLATALEISKRQIQRELNSLIELGIVYEKQAPRFNASRIIEFNKSYMPQVTNKTPHDNIDTATGDGLDTSTGDKLDTQDIYTKDNTKDSTYTVLFNHYLSKPNLIKHKVLTGDMKKGIDRAMKELKLSTDDCLCIIDRHSEKVEATKNKGQYAVRKRPLAVLFGQKKRDSVVLICSDYLDENYTEAKKPSNKKNGAEIEWL